MNLGDTFTTVIIIILAAGLMFIFPLSSISEMNDNEALAMVQSHTTEYVNKIRTTGVITEENYNEFVQKLHATGNTYDVEFELHISDSNPGKKTEEQYTGDSVYYVLYTQQVMSELNKSDNNNIIKLKQGDYIVVYVKNTNTTMSQMFKTVMYNLTGDLSYVIFAQHSGTIISTGSI